MINFNIIDITIILFICYFAYSGFKNGFIRELGNIIAYISAFLLSKTTFGIISNHFYLDIFIKYEALREKEITSKDVVIGISASGKTPFVLAALSCARDHKAATIGIACNVPSPILDQVDVPIGISVGPEILTGSTRLKAGTAQKMVLNMLSTASMVKLGKVFQNLMVDVKPKNQKLIQRAQKIIMQVGEVDLESASKMLLESGNDVKIAIVMARFGYGVETAKQKLINANGFLNRVLENPQN